MSLSNWSASRWGSILAGTLTVTGISSAGAIAQQSTLELPAAQPAANSASVEILNPAPDTVLDVPAATVILRFPLQQEVSLRVNGEGVDSGLIGRTETDAAAGQITQTWYGVPLRPGQNQIEAVSEGSVLATLSVTVRGIPAQLTVFAREASTPADGRSAATLQGQLLDETGTPSNWNTVVTLEASGGEFIGNDLAPDQPGFQVQAENGSFSAELRSPLTAETLQVRAAAAGLEAYNRVTFTTPQRPSIATGVVDLRFGPRGTDFYDSFREFLPLDGDNGYRLDLDAAVFATGSIGEWLFTGAYNSDRPLNENCLGETALFRTAGDDCRHAYPTAGDDSSQTVVAPSIDSLYLRLERTSPYDGAGTDYVMWGDFETTEFSQPSQLFTATARQLHGFKLNYNLGDLAVTGFYGNNVEGFQRDAIAPDGTGGLYFLSRRLVIPGSEVIVLELEELDRPGTVIDRQRLYRGSDYDIDYERGTLLFNDPVYRTAVGDLGTVLVRRITATYQYEGQGTDTSIFAGRAQYTLDRTLGQDSWVGASYLQENQGARRYRLFGADAQIALGDTGQLIAEVARSDNSFDLSGPVSGSAYRLELDGTVGDWLVGRAYWRQTDAGFTNAATTTFTPGQTRYGAEAEFALGATTRLRTRYDREANYGIAPRVLLSPADLLEPGSAPVPGSRVDNSLTTFSLGLTQEWDNSTLDVDWIYRDRTDRTRPGLFNATSNQLRTRLTTEISDTLTVTALNDLNLSTQSDPLYPSRTAFGLSWEISPGISLGLNQIFFGGGLNNRDAITTVDLSGQHRLGENTTLTGRFSMIEGQQVGGNIGIEHGITLAPGLRLDLGYERVFNNFYGTAAGTQFVQPYAVGTGASALGLTSGSSYTVGLSYTDNPNLQASTRFEHRSSSQSSNTLFTANAIGRLSPSTTVLFDYQLANIANQALPGLGTSSTLKLGLAYRDPNSDRFNALLRYEHRLNPNTLPTNGTFGSSLDTAEHLFSAEAIYAPSWQWEFYAKYAFRSSTTRLGRPADLGGNFISSNSLHLAQLRATYRFAYAWDITGEARWIGGIGGYGETGYSLEAGYYPTPDLRVYAGYSGGSATDRDFGVNRSAGGFYIGIAAKINSLFDGFGLQDLAPPQQQESVPESDPDLPTAVEFQPDIATPTVDSTDAPTPESL